MESMEQPPEIPKEKRSGCGVLAVLGILGKGAFLALTKCGDDAGKMAKMASAETSHVSKSGRLVDEGVAGTDLATDKTTGSVTHGLENVPGASGNPKGSVASQKASEVSEPSNTGSAARITTHAIRLNHNGGSEPPSEEQEDEAGSVGR